MTDRNTLEPIEKASRDELVALQTERLKWSLKHAYDNVPHYRRKFDEAGVHPDDLKTLADLAKFPFTTKQDLRENYPFGMFAVPREEVVRVHASSGTTGTRPKLRVRPLRLSRTDARGPASDSRASRATHSEVPCAAKSEAYVFQAQHPIYHRRESECVVGLDAQTLATPRLVRYYELIPPERDRRQLDKELIEQTKAKMESMKELQTFIGSNISSFLSDIISGGKNAEQALMNLTKRLADAAMQAMLSFA